MFKFPKDGLFEADWGVQVYVPVDGGRHQIQKFTARFKVLSQEELKGITGDSDFDDEMLNKILIGWGEDLVDDAGQPLPFNEENKKAVLDIPFVRLAIIRAYGEAVANARRKN